MCFVSFPKMGSPTLEKLVLEEKSALAGKESIEPGVQPGMNMNYIRDGIQQNALVRNVFMKFKTFWRVLGEDSLTKEIVVLTIPTDRISSSSYTELTNGIRIGDEYQAEIHDEEGRITYDIARVLTQSSLNADSMTYLRLSQSGNVHCVNTAYLKGIKPQPTHQHIQTN